MLGVGCGPQVGPFLSRPTMGSIRGEGTPPQTLAVIWRKKGVFSLSSGCSRRIKEGDQPPPPPLPPPPHHHVPLPCPAPRPPPPLALITWYLRAAFPPPPPPPNRCSAFSWFPLREPPIVLPIPAHLLHFPSVNTFSLPSRCCGFPDESLLLSTTSQTPSTSDRLLPPYLIFFLLFPVSFTTLSLPPCLLAVLWIPDSLPPRHLSLSLIPRKSNSVAACYPSFAITTLPQSRFNFQNFLPDPPRAIQLPHCPPLTSSSLALHPAILPPAEFPTKPRPSPILTPNIFPAALSPTVPDSNLFHRNSHLNDYLTNPSPPLRAQPPPHPTILPSSPSSAISTRRPLFSNFNPGPSAVSHPRFLLGGWLG